MEGGDVDEKKGRNYYDVLGLRKSCTAVELRNAYKKLALRWHPDRCSASGNLKLVEEAKKKFQSIQVAYSVLSDDNKRFLYDVGVYDDDDHDENEHQRTTTEQVERLNYAIKKTVDRVNEFNEFIKTTSEIMQSKVEIMQSKDDNLSKVLKILLSKKKRKGSKKKLEEMNNKVDSLSHELTEMKKSVDQMKKLLDQKLAD